MAANQSVSVECPFARQATDAFLVFDVSGNETVDVREVGTIIRSLGKLFSSHIGVHLLNNPIPRMLPF